jgi:hypothetical protein
MNRASAAEIADRLLHDLTPVDPTAAGALGTEPDDVMPALAPADFATRHEAYLRAHRFTDATDWTPPVGVAMLRKAAGVDEMAGFEVDRYLGWPAQALAFRVGAQLWRQAREAAERRPGFDLRAFHMHALRLGPLGLGPLREVMS